jgi:hypothetical protein
MPMPFRERLPEGLCLRQRPCWIHLRKFDLASSFVPAGGVLTDIWIKQRYASFAAQISGRRTVWTGGAEFNPIDCTALELDGPESDSM